MERYNQLIVVKVTKSMKRQLTSNFPRGELSSVLRTLFQQLLDAKRHSPTESTDKEVASRCGQDAQ